MSITGEIMVISSIIGFCGTVWYGYNMAPNMTQIEAVGLVGFSVFIAILSGMIVAVSSIVIFEELLG